MPNITDSGFSNLYESNTKLRNFRWGKRKEPGGKKNVSLTKEGLDRD